MLMLTSLIRFADLHDMFPCSGLVIACVSGGVDSMCLLEALVDISRERGFIVSAAHFNHLLRGEESHRDEDFVREYCSNQNIPFYSERGDVNDFAKTNKLGTEEAAREMRYRFFYALAERLSAERIATAHTADDNAETALMNLIRGSGTAGLSGIPPKRGIVVRPMLCVARNEVIDFAKSHGIPFVEDSTNSSDVYTRNKIRHSIMPIIKEINPKFTKTITTASELSRADEEYLSELADRFIEDHCLYNFQAGITNGQGSIYRAQHYAPVEGIAGQARNDVFRAFEYAQRPTLNPQPSTLSPQPSTLSPHPSTLNSPLSTLNSQLTLDAEKLSELPFAISSRVVRKLSGVSLSYKHVKSVLGLCARGGAPCRLSLPGMTVYCEYGRITFVQGVGSGETDRIGFTPVLLEDGCSVTIDAIGMRVSRGSVVCTETFPEIFGRINKSFTTFLFKSADLCGRITVRPRREGDSIKVYGRNGTKTLKKLFIEHRIPARERARVPVIADDAGVLAVYGLCTGERALPSKGEKAVQVDFEGCE